MKCIFELIYLLLPPYIHVSHQFLSFFMHVAGEFQIITFDEYILIALTAERVVDIHPDIQHPVFVNQHVAR